VTDDLHALGSTLAALTDMRHAPPPLASVIARCLSGRQEDRFPDAASLRDTLSALRTSDKAWPPQPASPGVWMIPPSRATSPEPPVLAVPYDQPPIFATQPAPPPPPPLRLETTTIPPPSRSGPSWPRLAVLGLISLLLGGLLTIGVAWVRGQGTTPTAGNRGRPVPALTTLPSLVAGLGRVNDPSLAPQITNLTDRGTSLALTWTDASGGKALFVVVEVTGTGAVTLVQVDPGRTSVTVERIDPARPYCLAVLAVTDTAQAISPLQCTGVRGAPR